MKKVITRMLKKPTQKQILLALLIVSSFVVVWHDIFDLDISFIKKGKKILTLGPVISNLSLAYISSYIFYFIVVVLKEKSDKKNIYLHVYILTQYLIGRAYSVYHDIVAASGEDIQRYDKKTISKEQFIKLCNISNPQDIPKNRTISFANGQGQSASYGYFIYNSIERVKNDIDKIFIYMPFLDTEYVMLINKLQNSTFFITYQCLARPLRNNDFSAWADNMYEFIELVRALEIYNEAENIKHIK